MFNACEDKIKNRVIVIAEDIDLRVLYGLKYAKTISDDAIVFGTFTNDGDEQNLRLLWNQIKLNIPLVLHYSPDGGIVAPLLDFLYSAEYGIGTDEIMTVFLPRLVVTSWWHKLPHNHASSYIERSLSKHGKI